MSATLGSLAVLWAQPETAYGTPAIGNYQQLGFFRANLLPRRDLLDVRVLGLGTGRDATDPMLGELTVEGEMEVPINQEGFGHWLRLVFGAPSTTGETPDFAHVYASGAASLPSNTLVLDYGAALGAARYLQALGVRGNTLGIDFGTSGPATARLGVIAQMGALVSSAGAGTPVPAAGPVFNRINGTITRNGTPLALITEASLEFSNGVEALRTIRNDNRIAAAIPQQTAITGRLTARFAEGGLQAEAAAGTPVDLAFGWEATSQRAITFRIARAFLSQPQAPIEGPGGVSASFEIIGSAEGQAALTVTLKNAVESYA